MADENITLVLGVITTVRSQSLLAQEELIEDRQLRSLNAELTSGNTETQ